MLPTESEYADEHHCTWLCSFELSFENHICLSSNNYSKVHCVGNKTPGHQTGIKVHINSMLEFATQGLYRTCLTTTDTCVCISS